MEMVKTIESKRDLEFSHFTMENLQENIFWIDNEANIIRTNDAASKTTGYSREELLTMNVFDLNKKFLPQNWKAFWKRIQEEKMVTIESEHTHKSGRKYPVEIRTNYFKYEGVEYTCSIFRDLSQKKSEEDLLRKVSEATSGLTGQDFLIELAKKISNLVGMRYCFIAECADEAKTRLRTLAFAEGEKVLDNIEYNLDGAACQMVMNGDTYFLGSGVQKCFPKAMGIESYMAAPIMSPTTGEVIGHIAASDIQPISEEKNHTAILKIFAARIGAEFERMNAQKRLEIKNHELQESLKENDLYQTTIENLQDQVFWLDKNGNFIRVNNAASRVTGYSMKELSGMNAFDLNPTLTKKQWTERWTDTKKLKHQVLESNHRAKNGTFYPIEVTNNFIEHDGIEYFCSVVRDLTKKKRDEKLIQVITEGTAGVVGMDFFETLTKYITTALNVRFSIVTECTRSDKTRLRTIAFAENGNRIDNVEYDTEQFPCSKVVKGEEVFIPENLEKLYPEEKGLEAYMAVPVLSPTTGEVLGHIAAFDSQKFTKEENHNNILKIFAARAGAEIERKVAEEKLKAANEKLHLQMKEIESLKNRLQMENTYLQEEIKLTHNFDEIISKSKVFQKVLRKVEQVASTDATVLILGESGTGKELLCRAIHSISKRSTRPLVKINCAALPANLIESELFGHERGAFTGATERKIGRFELADGGTIFLDELGELPIELQSKLLRVLQEGEFERLGNPRTMKVNVRVIAATNRDLEKEIEKNNFREDLYYRLNVFPIESIPLRDRKEDIPLLVKHFCKKYEAKIGKKITNIPQKIIDALMSYDYPGNIRELENIVERALIISSGETLQIGDWLPKKTANAKSKVVDLNAVEKNHIIEILNQANWKVSGERGAAKMLGLKPTTLEARMKKLGIVRE
ncbi:MAG: sigma 54-interacting transcriptional regulator [Bacteroidia bacterium]